MLCENLTIYVTILYLFFIETFFEIIVDSTYRYKKEYRDPLHILPSFSQCNILQKYTIMSQPGYWHWYNLPTIFKFLQFYWYSVCVCAKWLQWCLTICDPIDKIPPVSSVHGISQAKILDWVAISSSRHLPHPEMDPLSLISSALAGEFFTTSTTSAIGKPQCVYIDVILSHVKLEYPPH